MADLNRQAAIDALDRIFDRCEEIEAHLPEGDPDRTGYKMYPDYMTVWKYLHHLPAAQPDVSDTNVGDTISRHAAIDALWKALFEYEDETEKQFLESDELDLSDWMVHRIFVQDISDIDRETILNLPSVHPERDAPKRVLWTGWKGYRYTRYNCPNCKKPVRNDDVYCHRCGQKLMFPKVSYTDYVEGQKQEVIVRWDDE